MYSKNLQLQLHNCLKLLIICFINFIKFCEAKAAPYKIVFKSFNYMLSYFKNTYLS